VTLLISGAVWYLFIFEILPLLRITKSYKMVKDDNSLAQFLVIGMPIIMVCGLPFTRFLVGALGYTRQRTLRQTFYHPQEDHEEWKLSEINQEEWPIPPLYICNCVQHDIMDTRDTMPISASYYRAWEADGGYPTTYNHFEVMSHHWGNGVIGFWKVPTQMRLSTPMSMSAAATSQTNGSAIAETGWAGSLSFTITFLMGLLGMEMGRSHTLRCHGKWKPVEVHDRARYFDLSLQRLPEILAISALIIVSLLQYFALEDRIKMDFEGAPIAVVNASGMCYGADCTNEDDVDIVSMRYYKAAVVTYYDDATGLHRTIDVFQYTARYGTRLLEGVQNDGTSSFRNLCADQTDFYNCKKPLINFDQVPWMLSNIRTGVYPLYPPSEMKCYRDVSYRDMMLFFVGYFNDHPEVCASLPDCDYNKNPCTTGACLSASLAQGMVYSRYLCGTAYGYTWFIFAWSHLLLLIAFLAPSFTNTGFGRWVMYSHLQLMLSRMIGFKVHIPDPIRHPPPEVFLTDGGHIDNSGAYPLLRRKCKAIVSVDGDFSRECSTIYMLMELSRRKLSCAWDVAADETVCVDAEDFLLDFRLPRARFVGRGEHAADTLEEGLVRERIARQLMLGEQADGTVQPCFHNHRWEMQALKNYISHVRLRDGHAYIYFVNDATANKAFTLFPFIRENFKLAQAIDVTDGLFDEDYLSTEVMHNETLRHSAHFRIKYCNGTTGDFYYLRGECAPQDLAEVRESLKPYEPSTQLWTTIGQYPGHSTLGEGWTYAHIDAYAKFSRISAEHAWNNGLKELIQASTTAYPRQGAKEENPVADPGADDELIFDAILDVDGAPAGSGTENLNLRVYKDNEVTAVHSPTATGTNSVVMM